MCTFKFMIRVLKNLKKVAELRPNFKIVVMSATIKA